MGVAKQNQINFLKSIIIFSSMEFCEFSSTRVIQKIRRQRCCQVQKVFKKSNLTHGKIPNNIFYQQVMFQLIWLSSLHYMQL